VGNYAVIDIRDMIVRRCLDAGHTHASVSAAGDPHPVTTNTTSAHIGTSAASNGVSLLLAAAATVGVRAA